MSAPVSARRHLASARVAPLRPIDAPRHPQAGAAAEAGRRGGRRPKHAAPDDERDARPEPGTEWLP